ncbi:MULTISPECIES: DUF1214 domain-containing protein [Thermomonospora]|uniref:Uncharacterized protein n=1 Tax=Thermomonospora curvata (strain ATCC 19995 / DSM 43183 / JCM 3096 / KCTC 9072 / NBRC 15933 / NCIMB 10081 / Henssen B9) TaxID=471852 RepID=D1A607_THECD|nr:MULTISPECIES: DUF1214 domain-containing protein [Thermomonospora]ACY98302.1 hypothetical protein Tcur_2756 [Thermomonospora curvata DSM 43183]PKK13469.1 MAG: DUF1214 domain-containing protein [Thermomonospora sp. CIF 1]
MVTQSFARAIAEAEQIIRSAPHVQTEQDLAEGLDYLAGSIKACLHMAWAYQRDFPFFARSTGPYTKLGLDNPDTLYFHAYLRDDAEYVVTGRRGTTADLSFQVMNGDYSPARSPDSLTAFDDREIQIAPDGSFELRFGPPKPNPGPNYFALPPGSAMLIVREVFSDWDTERPGEIRIHRADTLGSAPPPPTAEQIAKRYEVAGRMLVARLRTFLAFPQWHYLNLPVNTMTEPRPTPGGLATQYSSVGHYDLDDEEVMVITVPAAAKSDAPYQGFQLGSMWYISLDYINHQTSLTADQARIDPDGMIRYVVSERDPGLANWIERTGHRRGFLQIRWQRLSRELKADDGPTVEIMPFDELPRRLPYYEQQRVTPQEWAARIAARQSAVARRMLG